MRNTSSVAVAAAETVERLSHGGPSFTRRVGRRSRRYGTLRGQQPVGRQRARAPRVVNDRATEESGEEAHMVRGVAPILRDRTRSTT
jgi:hypothetical protein